MTLVADSVPSTLVARVDEIFARWDTADGPGCAIGVVSDGALVLERFYGMADIEHGIKHSRDSVFDIASTSKQFTAAAILLLSDRGEVDLDDPIQAYLPEIPEYDSPVTVRHLVHHTSGLRDYLALRHVAGYHESDHYDMQDALEMIARQKALNFTPGTKYTYSNSGYILQAIIVSRVSGESFNDFCRTNFFEPLGMDNSRFREDVTSLVPGLVVNYVREGDGRLRKTIADDDIVGDGCLHTTIGDLARWERNFIDEKVGGPGFTERRSRSGTPEDEHERYGFGLSIGDYRGLKTVSHGGNLAGYSGEFLRFPDKQVAVICLANLGAFDASGLARKVADVFLEDQMEPAKESGSKNGATAETIAQDVDLGLYAGLFRQPDSGAVIDVVRSGDELVAEVGEIKIKLTPRGGGRFAAHYQEMVLDAEFEDPPDGARMLVLTYVGDPLLTLIEIVPPVLSPADLEAFTGDFYSEELDVKARIRLDGGKLYLHRMAQKRDILRPTLVEEFAAPFGGLKFSRDGGGKVDGYTASMSRGTGMRFQRI